jgi:hypothetical protein
MILTVLFVQLVVSVIICKQTKFFLFSIADVVTMSIIFASIGSLIFSIIRFGQPIGSHSRMCTAFLPVFIDVLMKLLCASRFHSVFYMLTKILH